MPKTSRKNKEISVRAPDYISEKDALLRDTTGVEAWDVSKVAEKISRGLSGLMIAIGTLLSLISVVSILTSIDFTVSNPIFIGSLCFFGAMNLFCGLILLAKK